MAQSAAKDGDHSLRGRSVWVVASGMNILDGVVAGLHDVAAQIILMSDFDSAECGAASEGQRVAADFSSRQSVAATIDAAREAHGIPELVVVSILPKAASRIAPLTTMNALEWRSSACDGIQTVMWILQALSPHLKPGGGAVAFVAPSLSLVGARDLVAMSTLLEGQRGLMKSVARQWGASGVSLNWISAAPRALSAFFDDALLAAKPDAVSVALGKPVDPRTQIVPALGFLASSGGRALTGITLTLDGGEWMLP